MQALATFLLATHLLWILWVIFGAIFTRGRAVLTGFHVASLMWGLAVELGPWPCPLTVAEDFSLSKTGGGPYQGGFIYHYLNLVVYPDVPESILVCGGVAVCVANLVIYGRRFWKARALPTAHHHRSA